MIYGHHFHFWILRWNFREKTLIFNTPECITKMPNTDTCSTFEKLKYPVIIHIQRQQKKPKPKIIMYNYIISRNG